MTDEWGRMSLSRCMCFETSGVTAGSNDASTCQQLMLRYRMEPRTSKMSEAECVHMLIFANLD